MKMIEQKSLNYIFIKSDYSQNIRRVRESRQELRKFLREVKKNDPAAVVSLQYDKLFVNHRCYVYNTAEGKVVEHTVGYHLFCL